MFSRRSALPRTHSRLARAIDAARARGAALLDLTVSNPTEAELPLPYPLLDALAHPDGVHYQPEPFGLRSAREVIATFMRERGVRVEPERVVLTASTSEAYGLLFKLLCDAGDGVLAPAPSYPLLEHLATFEHVELGHYALRYDGRWHVAPESLEAAAAALARPRAVITVSPNNPTGNYASREDLATLTSLGLPLIADEVFSPFSLDPSRPGWSSVTSSSNPRDAEAPLCFTLHGLSKLALLPQMKLSWLCVSGPDRACEEALSRLELLADAYLSVATPIQLALPAILRAQPAIERAALVRLRQNLETLTTADRDSPISCLHVEGGFYAVLRLPAVLDDEAWALALLQRCALIVQPGYLYDFRDGAHLILSLLTPPARFAEGLTRLREAVRAAV